MIGGARHGSIRCLGRKLRQRSHLSRVGTRWQRLSNEHTVLVVCEPTGADAVAPERRRHPNSGHAEAADAVTGHREADRNRGASESRAESVCPNADQAGGTSENGACRPARRQHAQDHLRRAQGRAGHATDRPSGEARTRCKGRKRVDHTFRTWKETSSKRSTQLLFVDLSTPNPKRFNVYDDIRSQLIAKGVPEREIAFIHDAKTDHAKKKLYDAVNAGRIRILLGSTEKLGAGTNVQQRLIAVHHLDAPWRPRDIEQRDGRILRQGN
jgi:hypothetical protein